MNALTPSPELLARLLDWAEALGLNLLAALATFIIGRWLAGLLIAGLKKALNRAKVDATLAKFLGHVAYGLIMAMVVISALGQLGVSTTSAAALLGGAGVAIGLSLKNQLSAFAAGVLIILFRPFRSGDYIEAGGTAGTVEDIRIFATVIRTPNNQEVTVPNDRIWGGSITNFTIRPTRRIDLPVGISYDADLRQAKTILAEIADAHERVLKDPAPWQGVTELGNSAIIISFRAWVNTGDFLQTRSDMIEQIKLRFDAAGIGIPYPQMDVHLHADQAAPAAD